MGSPQKAGSENWGVIGEIIALCLHVCSVLLPKHVGERGVGGMVWAKPVRGTSKLLNFPYYCIIEYHRSGNFLVTKHFMTILLNFSRIEINILVLLQPAMPSRRVGRFVRPKTVGQSTSTITHTPQHGSIPE